MKEHARLPSDFVPNKAWLKELVPTQTAIDPPPTPQEAMTDSIPLRGALYDFSDYMNKGFLETLIRVHPRSSQDVTTTGKFGLHPVFHHPAGKAYRTLEGFKGRIWMDGQYGFGLTWRPHDAQEIPRVLAVTSFLERDQLYNYWPKYCPDKGIPDELPNSLVIVQIQGPSKDVMYESSKAVYESTLPIVQSIQYQKILVSSVVAFADSVGISDVGILAASRNKYVRSDLADPCSPSRLHQLYPIYDLTAKNMGFAMSKNGVHLLSLDK